MNYLTSQNGAKSYSPPAWKSSHWHLRGWLQDPLELSSIIFEYLVVWSFSLGFRLAPGSGNVITPEGQVPLTFLLVLPPAPPGGPLRGQGVDEVV